MSVPQAKGEALASLLASLPTAKSTNANSGNDESTKAKLKSIAERLSTLLGEAPTSDLDGSRGQVLNEDGEPIVEITERVSGDSHATSAPVQASRPPPPETTPDNAANAEIKDDEWFAHRRRKREALMAQLELEEEEKALGRERRYIPPNAYAKYRTPTETLKVTTPSHNRALEIVERPPPESTLVDTIKPPKAKQVSFADDAPPRADPSALPKNGRKEDWGDVVPGKLRDAQHESLRALKMDVIERAPDPAVAFDDVTLGRQVRKLSFTPRKVQIRQAEVDSDDEDQTSSIASQSSSAQDDEDNDDQKDSDGEGDDWDEAMFQRELALAYYEQKGMLEQMRQSVQAPPIPNYPTDPGSWEQENVPLDASLASSKHRSTISRFKAERTAQYQASNPLPGDPFLAASVRHGKIVDGQLVANTDDISDDEGLNENAKRIIAELMGRRIDDDDAGAGISNMTSLADNGLMPDSPSILPPPVADKSRISKSEQDSVTSSPPSQSPPRAPLMPTQIASSSTGPAPKKISRFKLQQMSSSSSTSPATTVNSIPLGPASSPAVFERGSLPVNPSTTSNATGVPVQSSLKVSSSSSNQLRRSPELALARTTKRAVGSAAASSSSSEPQTSGLAPVPFSSEPYGLGIGTGGGGFTSTILTPEQAATPLPQPMKSTATRPKSAVRQAIVEKGMNASRASPAPSPAYPQSQPQGTPQKVSRFKAEREQM